MSENGGGDIDHPQLWVYAPNVVPEPASVVLLGVGGLGACALAWRGRMGRKKSTGLTERSVIPLRSGGPFLANLAAR